MKLSDIWERPQTAALTKQITSQRPIKTEALGGYAAAPFLKNLFTGEAQDFNLASGFLYPAIAIPARLTGVPILDAKHKELQTLLLEEGEIITRTMLITGTAWRWARWSDKMRRLTWQVLQDTSIGSQGVIIDIATGEIKAIRTDEYIEYNSGGNRDYITKNVERKLYITRESITEEYSGDFTELKQYENKFGFMPVPFGHECWEGEWRGQPVYGRVARLIKDNHDMRRNRDEILAEFKPKMIQTTADPALWVQNNMKFTSQKFNEVYNPFSADFVLNKEGERTEYLNIGAEASVQHTAALENNEKEIIIGSGLPEIFFGQIATGNAASTDSQIVMGVEYIKSIRREMTRAYKELLNQSIKLLAYTRFEVAETVKELNWDELNMASAEAKARIMGTYAGALSAMLSNGSVSKDGALYLTRLLYPDWPEDDADKYIAGINDMLVEHSSHIGQQVVEGAEF